ncbi:MULTISPECIES: hypothetical protein [Deinococcus]|uniref:Uncharacterized protein n=1 Tax=Deinococcus multiflagellatus TaxID=1656887 RepID=A0ABW1ZME3_9DEIO|nr:MULTISPECIES: hypothetical protein [Deinococcus]MBZ9714873.1 hypothetical protein [Deinococcus multiflagellatus]
MNRLLTLASLTLCAAVLGTAHASCAAPKDMNGVWRANDGGTYYVRQLGNQVWWVGMSSDSGKSWTNVFHGTRTGNTVKGTWADVPRGQISSGGSMTLTLSGVNSVLGFKRTAATGNFGGSTWYMPCDDVILNPVP